MIGLKHEMFKEKDSSAFLFCRLLISFNILFQRDVCRFSISERKALSIATALSS